ncbi:MAG: NTP transferase domain-containing protein [Lachnospiraceae bacterium]|nr:NTP transferase domain-containing protein [Lachnospiraceae bacterium]
MNIQESDILKTLINHPYSSQRNLALFSGYSLGVVNRTLRSLQQSAYLTKDYTLTSKAREAIRKTVPRNAIILAAGFGMRMVPINLAAPKALLEVHGEPLIERQIRQLHEVGIRDITVVVGFMKERFEYLIDEYGVELAVNPEYAAKNNIASLALVADRISNSYIIPSDIWCENNPFSRHELYSWYMVSDRIAAESDVRVNRKMELVQIPEKEGGNAMIGIAYLLEKDAARIRESLKTGAVSSSQDFWEITLYDKGKMILPARLVRADEITEINTYEQLRELDGESNHLKSDALDVIASVFETTTDQISDIAVLKKGMTNRSFLFTVRGEKYIMRIPGEGTDQLINRQEEATVFRTISGKGLCDDPVYINPQNGYKITKFLEGVRVCDSESPEDLKKCMEKLRAFHAMKLQVFHTFDIFGQIDFYESLWNGQRSIYRDYEKTKANVMSLRAYIDAQEKDRCLTHIDAVPDNFLFYTGPDGKEALQLTDWEYAGMQDPHVDIAMFCIYSLYGKRQTDRLIDLYFEEKCRPAVRAKIYCYVAACGLLWSNWCEYKSHLGIEFGEYSLRQYRYAKDFYRYARAEMEAAGHE